MSVSLEAGLELGCLVVLIDSAQTLRIYLMRHLPDCFYRQGSLLVHQTVVNLLLVV